MNSPNTQTADLNYLLSPTAVRQGANDILALTIKGETNFNYHPEKMNEVVDYVIDVINENYPSHEIPFHSRWGHFRVAQVDRVALLDEKLQGLEPLEVVRTKLDLVITSVLLDAGAGNVWTFKEPSSGKVMNRSEGLGVASFHLFMSGLLSDDLDNPLRATARGLQALNLHDLADSFQVSEKNPLVGLEGRLSLMHNLGKTVEAKPDFFPQGRPGSLVDYLLKRYGMTVTGPQVLRAVLDSLGDIWPGRIKVGDTNLGDTWIYKKIPTGLACFHKLSQWMTYSLLEPLIEAGFEISEVEDLTGLAEYRNGGLLLDKGLISLKNPTLKELRHSPDSEVIIEWRGLTVSLLDKIGNLVQKKLNKSPTEFPLAKVLEGGTWWAGRRAARSLRADCSPPLKIDSDGTVF
ncbi:MAG: URC4/urg3 family protein [Bacillota bacterium]